MSQTGSYFSSEVTFRILIQRVRFGLGGAARKGASGGWTLETLRNMALEQNFACAVVFLGGGSSIGEILENADLSQCGYVKEIPESRYVSAPDGGYELYCIVPAYGATLAVNEWVCNEGNGFVGETGQVLYRSDEADPHPAFLQCQ